jgi:hypothetical protein
VLYITPFIVFESLFGFGFGLAWKVRRILLACTRTMFNDKLLEYRENGDLERLSRQVALPFPNSASLFGLQKYFRTLLDCDLEKASAHIDKL